MSFVRPTLCVMFNFLYPFVACPTGRYGKNCLFDCECGGSTCDPTNGECICTAGKMGDHCEQGTLLKKFALNYCLLFTLIEIETVHQPSLLPSHAPG